MEVEINELENKVVEIHFKVFFWKGAIIKLINY